MSYPLSCFKEEVSSFLASSLSVHYESCEIDIDKILETPPGGMADIAFPCFSLGKLAKQNPSSIATSLIRIPPKSPWIAKTEAKNGYVNFFINHKKLSEVTLRLIQKKGDLYGHHPSCHSTLILEHTSTNPTGPLHIGRARNPIIGDTLARIFRAGGYTVETQFYLDDMGKQIAILVWGVDHLDLSPDSHLKPDHAFVSFYQKAAALMKKDPHVAQDITDIIHGCEEGDSTQLNHAKKIYAPVLTGIIQSLRRLNISLDSFIEESRFLLDGSVNAVITKLAQTPYCGKEDNALYLNLDAFGIHGRNKNFFLTRNDGTSLYATRDIAYHLWKSQHADGMINILGEDHKLEARQVAIALKLLDANCPLNVFYSFVSLPEGRMSTRKGQVVYLDDLMDEAVNRARKEVTKRRSLSPQVVQTIAEHVGVGAIRYNLIKVQADKPITFRWEDALNFDGESAPFIQYAYARCHSILEKTNTRSVINPSVLTHKTEIALIKKLATLPEVIIQAIHHYNPAYVAEYGYHLAASVNHFYRDCRVIGDEYEKERLALVEAAQQVLKNTLSLLGIQALENM